MTLAMISAREVYAGQGPVPHLKLDTIIFFHFAKYIFRMDHLISIQKNTGLVLPPHARIFIPTVEWKNTRTVLLLLALSQNRNRSIPSR